MSKAKESVSTATTVILEALHALHCVSAVIHSDGTVTVTQQFDRRESDYPSVGEWLKEAIGSSSKTDEDFNLEARMVRAGFDKACVRTNNPHGLPNDLVASLGGLKVIISIHSGLPFEIRKIDVDEQAANPAIVIGELECLLSETSWIRLTPKIGDYTSRALSAIYGVVKSSEGL